MKISVAFIAAGEYESSWKRVKWY